MRRISDRLVSTISSPSTLIQMNTSPKSVPVRAVVIAVLLASFCNQADAQRPSTADQRDPTIPSAEIQRRARVRPPVAPASSPVTRSSPVTFRPRISDPSKIVLQSIVQASEDRCTATLRAGDQTVTVSFVRNEPQREVELPATQFADFASTVQRLSLELRQLRAQATMAIEEMESDAANSEENLPSPRENVSTEETIAEAAARAEAEMLQVEREFMRQAMQPQRIDLSSSFTLNGNLYRVIDFSSDTLLLEQVPLGKYVIVR